MDKKIKLVNSILLGAIITIIFVVAITISAELIPALKDWLKNTFSHHWVGKSILSLAFFAISSFMVSICPCIRADVEKTKKLSLCLFWTSIGATAIIFVFFIWEAFIK